MFSPRKACSTEIQNFSPVSQQRVLLSPTALQLHQSWVPSTPHIADHFPSTYTPTELTPRPLRYILVSRIRTPQPFFLFSFYFTPSHHFYASFAIRSVSARSNNASKKASSTSGLVPRSLLLCPKRRCGEKNGQSERATPADASVIASICKSEDYRKMPEIFLTISGNTAGLRFASWPESVQYLLRSYVTCARIQAK